jgi:hypothetical protein
MTGAVGTSYIRFVKRKILSLKIAMITVSYILFFVLSAPLPPKSGCGFEKSPASLSLVNNLVSNRYVYPVSHTEVGTKHPLLLCEVASLRSTSVVAFGYDTALLKLRSAEQRGWKLRYVARVSRL